MQVTLKYLAKRAKYLLTKNAFPGMIKSGMNWNVGYIQNHPAQNHPAAACSTGRPGKEDL